METEKVRDQRELFNGTKRRLWGGAGHSTGGCYGKDGEEERWLLEKVLVEVKPARTGGLFCTGRRLIQPGISRSHCLKESLTGLGGERHH